jgi:hypothetical protein
MTPDTILDLAKTRGYALTPARAKEIANAVNATLDGLGKMPVPFEAEPAAFDAMLEALASPTAGGRR